MSKDEDPHGWITWENTEEEGCKLPSDHHFNAQTNEKLQRLKG